MRSLTSRSAAVRVLSAVFVLCGVAPAAALAVNPAEWQFDLEVTRGDTSESWTSPTAVDTAGNGLFQYTFEITKVTGTVNIPTLGNVTQDITDEVDADLRRVTGETPVLPAVVLDDVLAFPDSGTSLDLLVEIDGQGFGQIGLSDITLGSVDVPLFGTRPIDRLNLEGRFTVTGVVPEPGSLALLLLLTPAGIGLRRRHCRRTVQ